MAGIPLANAASIADLEDLLAAADPSVFLVTAIDPVREAPLFHELVRNLQQAGWTCRNAALVRRAATFSATLDRLAVEVFPVLLDDPYNLVALRAMRSCGHAALRVRQSSAAEGGDLYDMAGRLSNCLERKARQAIKELQDCTIPAEWIVAKATEVELIRAGRIALLAPALPPQPPLRVVGNYNDVLQLLIAAAVPLQEIDLVAVEVLRDAPFYRFVVADKLARGWTCASFAQLDRAGRFVRRLEDLGENIIPPLMHDPENRAALFRLRACGKAISKIRRGAHGVLADMMAKYANGMTRAARNALNLNREFDLTHEWVYDLAFLLYEDCESMLLF